MKFFVYRNCFTGDISGGDMHTGGVAAWIHEQHPEQPLTLVHADNDNQVQAYQEVADLQQATYRGTTVKLPAVMYPLRAYGASRMKRLPFDPQANVLIAGSHFLPDVMPVVEQGKRAPGAIRAVYIHHIVQDMPRPHSLNTWLANRQEQHCFGLIRKYFDVVITVNQDVVEGLRQRGFTQPILCSSNFVSKHNITPIAYDKKDITLVFCGRFVGQKGIDDFVATCQILQSTHPNFKAVMIGVGPELDRIRRAVSDYKLNIELVGRVSDDQKFNLMARSKLFVFPSVEEGWGIAIAEALSVGTPVVAYDLPVYKLPFGDAVAAVPLGEGGLLTEKVNSLLNQYNQAPASYQRQQQSIVERASNFTRDKVAQDEYNFILNRGN
jgi:glycosyltransferase involved in cell wall biosynthesis